MTSIFKSCTRALGAGSAALLLTGAAMAQAEPHSAAVADDTVANQIVVRDATTGVLRAATASEARAITPQRAAGPRLNTVQRAHFSGARGVRLSNEFMHHSAITRLADGSVVEQCFHTPEEAAVAHKAMATLNTLPAALPTE